MKTKLCYRCDFEFEPVRSSQKFCSAVCRKEFHREDGIKTRSLINVLDVCRCCGKEFNPARLGQEFCTRECYFKYRHNQNKILADVVEKECTFCGEVFETALIEKVYCSKSCSDSMYKELNKEKISIQKKEWYKANRERLLVDGKEVRKTSRWKDSHRDCCYKKRYNISLGQYNCMFSEQDGKCAICGIHQKELSKRLFVDHEHSNGNVRGLLCHKCNSAIGLFNDDVELLVSAIKYLGGDY